MKRIITLLYALFLFSGLYASQKNSHAILLKSERIYPAQNIGEFISENVSQDEIVGGYYFRIIQFNSIPDLNMKAEIANSGIILNAYLPYYAWNCAIPANFDKTKLASFGVRSVIKLENRLKLNPFINGQDFPKHTIIVPGKSDLIIHSQENITPEIARQLFVSKGFEVISAREILHTITIRLPFAKLNELTSLPFVYYIEPIAVPSTKDDTEGRSLHRSNVINSDLSTFKHYDGAGVTVGLADDGVVGPHIDFTGRITQHLSGAGGNHGDMTSGICVGAGNLTQKIRGMGTGANLHVFDIQNYPQIDSAVYNYNLWGIVITSTSYGQQGTACNLYTTDTELADKLVHENKPFNFVFSAGNYGVQDCSYGAGNLWGNITGGYKLGKNVIAVGNLDEYDGLETSSSRGPAIDGRIKPDICSNGGSQRSTDDNNTYQNGSGTSAACPGIAGCLSQLYQAYKVINSSPNPPGGLMKAIILNTADDLGNIGPDFKHGWGRINARRALAALEGNRFFTDSLSQGQTKTFNLTVPPNTRQVRVMAYWNDKEGSPASAKALVNDLNLLLTQVSGGTTFQPWVLDPTPTITALSSLPVRGIDSLNNVEQVTIDNPTAGQYEIDVTGFQVPSGIQDFHVVYEFQTDDITVTYPNGGEGIVPGTQELIRWDAFDNTTTFNIEYTTNNGGAWTNISTGVNALARYYEWTVPNNIGDQYQIRVSRGANSDVSDSLFTIIPQPSNFHVAFICPDSIGLAWNNVNNASGYDVSMLGAKYMDLIGTSTTNNFIVSGLGAATEFWFSVKALGPNGGKGQRADAIYTTRTLNNCPLSIDGELTTITSPPSGVISDCQNLAAFLVSLLMENPGVSSISNFNVNYQLGANPVVTEQFTGSINNSGSNTFTFTQTINITTPGLYTLKAWLSIPGDLNHLNDTTTITFTVINGTTSTVPAIEDFETFTLCGLGSSCEDDTCQMMNGWMNARNYVNDDIDWRTNEGNTPSDFTGPSADHTTGTPTGNYVYIEASGVCDTKTALLISPCYDLTGIAHPRLSYWYSMFGASIGQLHVDIISDIGITQDIVPVKSGDHGDFWLNDTISLTQFSGKKINIRFRGITSNSYEGDMALDDIGVSDFNSGIEIIPGSFRPYLYPNPSNGTFHLAGVENNIDLDVIIHDMLGNIVFRKAIAKGTSDRLIDLTNQADGIYTATINSKDNTYQIKLLNIHK